MVVFVAIINYSQIVFLNTLGIFHNEQFVAGESYDYKEKLILISIRQFERYFAEGETNNSHLVSKARERLDPG